MKTKKEYFNAIADLLSDMKCSKDYIDFLRKEANALTRKVENAKAKAQTKRADSDALADAIADIVPDEFTTIADITALLNDPSATKAKVTYRLNALVADGVLEKSSVVVGKKTFVTYKHC